MDWGIIAAVAASLGGREFFIWLANRKSYARKERAGAKDAELSVHEKQLERYEQRLTTRDATVDSLYKELREEQKHNLDLVERVNKLEFDKEVLALQKCEVRGCALRQPPGAY